jgi:hypothetical protein
MPEKSNEFKTLEFPDKENFSYKGMRYIVKHSYQNSGGNLLDALKKQLSKTLETLDISGVRWYDKDVNIFG